MILIEKEKIYATNKTRIRNPKFKALKEYFMLFEFTTRDYQRSKVYAADQRMNLRLRSGGKGIIKAHPKQSLIGAVASYVDSVICKPEFCAMFGKFAVEVTLDKKSRRSEGGGGAICVGVFDGSANRLDVLHEIAHCLCPMKNEPAHGQMFASALLALIKIEYGENMWLWMRLYMREKGVKHEEIN